MKRRESGQSLVEFALILPIFVLMLVGLFDLGHAVYATSTTQNAAREAARLAGVDQFAAHICDEAASSAVGLGVDQANPCTSTTDDVDISVDYRDANDAETANSCADAGSATMIGCLAVVRVQYNYTPITPLIGSLVGPLSLAGESRFPVQNFCQTSSCPIGD